MANWISPYDCGDYDDYKDLSITSQPAHTPTSTYDSLVEAQMHPDSHKFLTDYEAMILAQYGTFSNDVSPNIGTSSSEPPSLNGRYLARLQEMTEKAWPRIRDGPVAEVTYYESLLSGEKLLLETKERALEEIGMLSRFYGPLPINMEKYKLVNKMTWTSSYRAEYDFFEGTDEQLLAQMAKAYHQAKLKLSIADANKNIKLKLSIAEAKTDTKNHARGSNSASRQPTPTTLGQSPYDNAHEHHDNDDDNYSEDEEDEYDQDEIFDDHNIEQYGRQGYGGWD